MIHDELNLYPKETRLPYEVYSDFEDTIVQYCNIKEFKSGKNEVDYRALPTQLIAHVLAKHSDEELVMLKGMVAMNYNKPLEPLMEAIDLVRSTKMAAAVVSRVGRRPQQMSLDLRG